MCGFAGIIQRNDSLHISPMQPILQYMGDQIAHRGPDDEQFYLESRLGIVFRRLSIIDIANGAQPLTNEDNSLVLVVNGEIYNHHDLRKLLRDKHSFKSNSDCEIILHLYEEMGINFLNHLNGMFALALWDRKSKNMLIARDRLGIKPLYYHCNDQRLIFGSEIKALLAYPDCPRELDWHAALSCSFDGTRQINSPPSFFKHINQLNGGEYLQYNIQTNSWQTDKYWTLPDTLQDDWHFDTRSNKQIITGYRELLEDSVRLQLMSDAGMGLFLSGGIDSVAIAKIASSHISIPTFTVLSRSTFGNGDVRSAAAAAKTFGLENHQVLYQWHDNAYDGSYWKRLLWHTETPLCSAEHLYKYELHRYAKQHFPNLKSVLLGQGSDEFNGGYCEQYVNPQHPAYQHGGNNWEIFMEAIQNMRTNQHLRGRNTGLVPYAHVLDKDFLAAEYGQGKNSHPWFYYTSMYARNLQMHNLWHEDRTASAHGIESRVPFLDHRLVEYCMNVPPTQYRELFWNKQILRKGFEGIIPDSLLQRSKVPFFHGTDVRYTYRMLFNMLIRDNRALLYEALGEPDQIHHVLNRAAFEQQINILDHDTECTALPKMLILVNMGLLEKMMTELQHAALTVSKTPIADRVTIYNYEEQESEIELLLQDKSEDLNPIMRELNLNLPLQLVDNVKLLNGMDGLLYIAVNNVLEYVLEESDSSAWIRVLNNLDNKRSLAQLLTELDLLETNIYSNLREGLDANIVEFVM